MTSHRCYTLAQIVRKEPKVLGSIGESVLWQQKLLSAAVMQHNMILRRVQQQPQSLTCFPVNIQTVMEMKRHFVPSTLSSLLDECRLYFEGLAHTEEHLRD